MPSPHAPPPPEILWTLDRLAAIGRAVQHREPAAAARTDAEMPDADPTPTQPAESDSPGATNATAGNSTAGTAPSGHDAAPAARAIGNGASTGHRDDNRPWYERGPVPVRKARPGEVEMMEVVRARWERVVGERLEREGRERKGETGKSFAHDETIGRDMLMRW
ncbi:hypothetical protein NpPPO83_00006810 [Neofusicoccum parvum]|uniref:Uncharacterized protein n=1 Tax=Neofusicoccum parvum TaxID=310453 RepID=A0ACB5SKX1_9PEZI|nr:hypothetical protein NpPPO83_00006810 [Neofusicoccum parvum]